VQIFQAFVLAVAIGLVAAIPASAQSSKDYAVMGAETWAAFSCVALAAEAKNTAEQERLFMLGYDKGKRFIEALNAGRIRREDVDSNVPVGLVLNLQGPTPDFMLGRIYEAAARNALDSLYRQKSDAAVFEAFRKSVAESVMYRQNCRLLR
jgi:hypothetical protein